MGNNNFAKSLTKHRERKLQIPNQYNRKSI